jgi:HEAT repeat protein
MLELQEILNNLKSSDWWVRKDSIDNLLDHQEGEYLPILEEWLRNGADALLRNAAMEAYRGLGAKSVASLRTLLADEDIDVRLFAANLLGDIMDASAIPALIQSIEDPDANVRIASAEAMGKIGAEQALPALKKALDDEQWVAMSALQSIGEIGGDQALGILYACLDHEEYRGFAMTAIQQSGNRDSLKYLTPFLDRDDHIFHRDLALEAITKIAERESIRLQPENVRKIVPMLIDTVKQGDTDTKKSAFIALCWSEDINGLPLFIEALKDETLLEYAIDGILGIGRKSAPAIIEELKGTSEEHRGTLVKVLSMLGEHSALIQFKKDENPEVRREVAQALGSLNSPTTVRALLKMLSDPFEDVRLAARKSLDKLSKTARE